MTTTILKDHALNNIWAAPLQDLQHRVKPSRISPDIGFYNEAKVMWERIPLPDYNSGVQPKGWHVYPIGQLPMLKFGLEEMPRQKWIPATDVTGVYNVVVDLYADNGCVIPRNNYYLWLNYDNNLIMAVERNGAFLGTVTVTNTYHETFDVPYSLDDNGVTIRFYKNAIIHAGDWLDTAPNTIHHLTDVVVKVTKPSEYANFLTRAAAIEASYRGKGAGIYYQDGFVISKPTGYSPSYLGSIFSFQYDETVKDIRFFNISDLPGFQSIIDRNKKKYLMVSNTNNRKLEYYDDCDYYLVNKEDATMSFRGVAIDPYNRVAVRQVTHDAWSLTEDAVELLALQHPSLPAKNHLSIMVKVRNGGMVRGIGLQANRVEELYHLSHAQRLEAMAGVNSTMPEWRAANLENSAYIRLMGSAFVDVTDTLVEEAYGYNAATYAVAKSISKVNAQRQITIDLGHNIPWDSKKPLPQATDARRVIFWYDVAGKYLGNSVSNSAVGSITVPATFPTADRAEIINGDLITGVGDVGTFPDQAKVYDYDYGYYGYRNYVCGIVNGVLDHKWIDVTDTSFCTYIKPADGSTPYIEWQYSLLNMAGYYPATRFANKVNVHNPSFKSTTFTGIMEYDINKIADSKLSLLGPPPGFVTVWMDGESLIENLDYYYRRGGNIAIVKTPKQSIDNTKLTIRFHGYMNPKTNKPFAPRDIGFVKNGVLSYNQVFNPWHDRDIRINVNGGLKFANEVQFAEAGSENVGSRYMDGMAYSVEDYQSLVEPFTNQRTVPYKMASLDIDQRMSAYLSERLPENTPHNEYITPARHELYSPTMARFIQLMQTGAITDAEVERETMDEGILERYGWISKQYQDCEPILLGYNPEYVSIRPHPHIEPVEVSGNQYAFLERVNRIFLKSDLDLTNSVKIKI